MLEKHNLSHVSGQKAAPHRCGAPAWAWKEGFSLNSLDGRKSFRTWSWNKIDSAKTDSLCSCIEFNVVPLFVFGGAEGSAPLMKAQASLSDANFLKEADGNLSTWLLHSSLKIGTQWVWEYEPKHLIPWDQSGLRCENDGSTSHFQLWSNTQPRKTKGLNKLTVMVCFKLSHFPVWWKRLINSHQVL